MKDVAIVGLPYAGKSTVFGAIARTHGAGGGGYKRPNVAVVTVPDERVDRLAEIYRSKKTTYAQVRLTDVAGLDQQSLHAARESDALAVVLGAFAGDADPARDLATFRAELALADLATMERASERVSKQARSGDARAAVELAAVQRAEAVLSSGRWLIEEPWEDGARRAVELLTPLTLKPVLHVVNADEAGSPGRADGLPPPIVEIRGLLEAEAAELDPAEASALLREFGVDESAMTRFVHAVYSLLDLVTFFTAGEPESIARPVRRGTTARRAAGEIHSDLERGFIRAEVVSYDDLVLAGSLDASRERGRLRVEGKDYVMQEGDVALIRHSA